MGSFAGDNCEVAFDTLRQRKKRETIVNVSGALVQLSPILLFRPVALRKRLRNCNTDGKLMLEQNGQWKETGRQQYNGHSVSRSEKAMSQSQIKHSMASAQKMRCLVSFSTAANIAVPVDLG